MQASLKMTGKMMDRAPLGNAGFYISEIPADDQAVVYGVVIFLFSFFVLFCVKKIKNQRPTIFSFISASILSPIGAIFGLIVTFLIADVWNKNANAELTVNNEALAINQILSTIPGLPDPLSTSVREKTLNYWKIVIDEELPILGNIKTIDNEISRRARHELYELLSLISSNNQFSSQMIFNLVDNIFKYRAQRMVVAVDVTESKRIELSILLAFFLILAVAVTHAENLYVMSAMTLGAATITSMLICFAVLNGKPFDYKASLLTKGGFLNIVNETNLLSNPIDMNKIK